MMVDKNSLKEIISRIRSFQGSVIHREKLGMSLTEVPEILEDVYEKVGYRCDDQIENYYKKCGSIILTWSNKLNGIDGFILIESFPSIMLGPKSIVNKVPQGEEFKNILWMEDWDDDEIERRKHYKAFEYIDGRGDWIALLIDEKTGASTLHYLDKLSETPLVVSFTQYIQLVFSSYGVIERSFLTKKEFFYDPYGMQPMLEEVRKLLPMEDFDKVIKEIKEIL